MDRALLAHLPAVLAVAKRRSFARAGADLGMGSSAVSHAVRTVEDRLGTPLFARTTRSVALTEAGAAFVARIEGGLGDIARAAEEAASGAGVIRGVLRINASRVAQRLALTPLIAAAAQAHPGLTIETVADDGLTDIVAEGFDAGVRLGEMIAADMVAVRLTPPFRAILAAAPAYLAARGRPNSVADLGAHNCIGYRLLTSGAAYAWDLHDAGQPVRAAVQGTARVTDATYALELAEAGVGIAYLFEPLARAALAAGRLEEILPEAAVEEPGLFLYFPRRASGAPKLRAFIDLAAGAARRRAGAPARRP